MFSTAKKSVIDALFLASWNLGTFIYRSRTLPDVNAADMTPTVSTVCSEGIVCPHTHFLDHVNSRRQTLCSFTYKGFLRPQEANWQQWMPTFFILPFFYC